MTIQEWGAIGEIIGGIAVVASLVYLAMQIRQNTKQLSMTIKSNELAAFERNVEAANDFRKMLITDPDVAELYARGIKRYAELGGPEKIRFDLMIRSMFSGFQGAYVRHLTFGSDPHDFEGTKKLIEDLLRLRGVRESLAASDPDWRPEFAALMDERLQQFDAD